MIAYLYFESKTKCFKIKSQHRILKIYFGKTEKKQILKSFGQALKGLSKNLGKIIIK
jgi:hypothetical protein